MKFALLRGLWSSTHWALRVIKKIIWKPTRLFTIVLLQIWCKFDCSWIPWERYCMRDQRLLWAHFNYGKSFLWIGKEDLMLCHPSSGWDLKTHFLSNLDGSIFPNLLNFFNIICFLLLLHLVWDTKWKCKIPPSAHDLKLYIKFVLFNFLVLFPAFLFPDHRIQYSESSPWCLTTGTWCKEYISVKRLIPCSKPTVQHLIGMKEVKMLMVKVLKLLSYHIWQATNKSIYKETEGRTWWQAILKSSLCCPHHDNKNQGKYLCPIKL